MGVIEDEWTQALIDLIESLDVLFAVVDNIAEGLLAASEGLNPDRPQDGILGCLSAEEFLDRVEAIVAKFQAVPGHLPAVYVGEVGRQGGQVMIKEPRVDEGDVEVGSKPGQPAVSGKEFNAEVLQERLFASQDIPFVVLHTDDLARSLADGLIARAEDNPVVGIKVRRFKIPAEYIHGAYCLTLGPTCQVQYEDDRGIESRNLPKRARPPA